MHGRTPNVSAWFDMLYKLRTFKIDAMSQFCPARSMVSIFGEMVLACMQSRILMLFGDNNPAMIELVLAF